METVATEADIDIIIVDEIDMTMMVGPGGPTARSPESINERAQVPVDIRNKFGKSVVVVMPVEAVGIAALEFEGTRRRVRDYYLEQGLPVYLTLERAAKALTNFTGYHRRNGILSSQ